MDLATIDRLPDEILLMIFSNISGHELAVSVSRVCQRWEDLLSHIILRIMDPGDENKLHGGIIVLQVTNYVPALMPSAIILKICTLIANIKELTLSSDYCLGENELKIVSNLQNLSHLDIFTENKVLEANTLLPPNITSFVANNSMAPGFLLSIEGKKFIKAFYMYGKSVHYPSKEMGKFLQHHMSTLTHLTLRCNELMDDAYRTISCCERLTSLQLYCCLQLTSVGASYLLDLTHLRRLHITGARMIRINSLIDIVANLPPLIKELNLSYTCFGDEHCSALAARLPKLRSLELWRTRISAVAIINLTNSLTSLQDLDTDVNFVGGQIRGLSRHRTLKNLRCRWIGQVSKIKTGFQIRSALEKVPAKYLRDDEEGPRAGLFYYWLQGVS